MTFKLDIRAIFFCFKSIKIKAFENEKNCKLSFLRQGKRHMIGKQIIIDNLNI